MNKTTRRDFVKLAAVAGAAPAFLGTARTAEGKRIGPNDRVRVATIGMGIMGFGDTYRARRVPGVEIVGAADCYDGRLVHTQEVFGGGVRTTRNFRDILARPDVDAVIVATPDHWHVPIALEALAAGKHVYLEKPAVHDVTEGPKLVEAARKSGKVLQVGSQRVSSVGYARAKELYDEGKLGKLNMVEARMTRNSALGAWQYTIPLDASEKTCDWDMFQGNAPKRPFDPVRFFRWRNYWDYGTGVGGDLFVHLFSGIHHVLGSHGPERIMATGGLRFWKDGRDAPDIMVGLFDYPETAAHPAFTLSLQVNFADGGGGDELFRFIGDEGTMTIDGGSNVSLRRVERRPESEEEVFRGWNSVPTFSKQQQADLLADFRAKNKTMEPAKPEVVEFKVPENYDEQYEHFANFFASIREGKPVVEDAAFGFRAAAPAVLCNTSYTTGQIVRWDPEGMKAV